MYICVALNVHIETEKRTKYMKRCEKVPGRMVSYRIELISSASVKSNKHSYYRQKQVCVDGIQ